MTTNKTQTPWTENVISVYTRAQAIEDGVLVDVSDTAAEAGIVYPVAVTSRVWEGPITPDDRSRPYGQSEAGRLWDVLMVFRVVAKIRGGSELLFQVIAIMKARQQRKITLKAIVDPGDDVEPVITVMFPEED